MKVGCVVAGLVVFCALSLYAHHLQVQVALQELKLANAQSENDQLVATEFSLNRDIERAEQLEKDIDAELRCENDTYQLLQETLNAIRLKLEGTERLERAVSRLEQEYGELVIEARLLEEMQR